MNTPLKRLIYKILAFALFMLAGYLLGAVNMDDPLGLVLPAVCSVGVLASLISFVIELKQNS